MESGVTRDYSHALANYQRSLAELTFNSKPLIDDLTRAAGRYVAVGSQVIQLVQKHIMKVATWSLKKNCQSHMVSFLFILIISVYIKMFKLLIFVWKKMNDYLVKAKVGTLQAPALCMCVSRFDQSGSFQVYTYWTPL